MAPSANDRLAGAVSAAITAVAAREALRAAGGVGGLAALAGAASSDATAPALARAAADLRRRIIAELLAASDDDRRAAAAAEAACGECDAGGTGAAAAAGAARDALGELRVGLSLKDAAAQPLPTRTAEVVATADGWAEAHLGCPHCRRPLEFGVRLEKGRGAAGAEDTQGESHAGWHDRSGRGWQKGERHAYCAVLADGGEAAFLQALVLGQSLISAGCRRERLLLHAPTVPQPYLRLLKQVWELKPMRTWPQVGNRQTVYNERAIKLRALECAEFSKVFLLDLGIIVRGSLDHVFDLECPAAAFRSGDGQVVDREMPGRRLDMSALLLQPCAAAYHRMAAEVFTTSAAWPPVAWSPAAPLTPEGGGGGMLEEYLLRFYGAFFSGVWSELPEAAAALRVDGVHPDVGDGALLQPPRRTDAWTRAMAALRAGGSPPEGWLASLVFSELQAVDAAVGGALVDVLAEVNGKRCFQCKVFDLSGDTDPLDRCWRCRFCWESLLLESALRDRSSTPLPLPAADAAELQSSLGSWYVPGGPQRWSWAIDRSLDYTRKWVEFRPKFVLWTSDGDVGAWRLLSDTSGKQRLALHICSGSADEVRHVMHEAGNSPSAGGQLELEEWSREVFRPLGLSRCTPERRARCRSRAPAAFAEARPAMPPPPSRSLAATPAPAEVGPGAPPTRPPPGSSEGSGGGGSGGGDARGKLAYLFAGRSAGPAAGTAAGAAGASAPRGNAEQSAVATSPAEAPPAAADGDAPAAAAAAAEGGGGTDPAASTAATAPVVAEVPRCDAAAAASAPAHPGDSGAASPAQPDVGCAAAAGTAPATAGGGSARSKLSYLL